MCVRAASIAHSSAMRRSRARPLTARSFSTSIFHIQENVTAFKIQERDHLCGRLLWSNIVTLELDTRALTRSPITAAMTATSERRSSVRPKWRSSASAPSVTRWFRWRARPPPVPGNSPSKRLTEGETMCESAERCGIAPSTAFRWRHRFLEAVRQAPDRLPASIHRARRTHGAGRKPAGRSSGVCKANRFRRAVQTS